MTPPSPLSAHIKNFIVWLKVEKGLSEHTLSAYKTDLLNLESFLASNELPLKPQEWSLEPLRLFIVQQDDEGYETATLIRRLACLRSFCRFAIREKLLTQDWASHLESPKLWRKLPEVLSLDEVQELLKAARAGKWPHRDATLVELLYGSGLRVSELVNLNLSGFQREKKLLHVRGKGDKDRYVPVGDYAIGELGAYLESERPLLAEKVGLKSPALLLGSRGNPWSRQSIYNHLRKLGQKAGLDKVVYPHIFRHSYATHLLENGADLRVIQELLGHADVSTTERYTHVNRKTLKEDFAHWHPRGIAK